MKRCPQCEFIYEDEQNLCDMDGKELVSEDGSLRIAPDAAAVPIPSKRKSSLKLFAVFAIPAVILGVLLPIAFQGQLIGTQNSEPISRSANQSEPAEASIPPVVIPEVSPSPSSDLQPTEEAPTTPDESSDTGATEEENAQQRSIARASADSVSRANTRAIGNARAKDAGIKVVEVSSDRPAPVATQPVNPRPRQEKKTQTVAKAKPAEDQNNSKIGTFLKRTGRILKKPFKL